MPPWPITVICFQRKAVRLAIGPGTTILKIDFDDQQRRAVSKSLAERKARLIETPEIRRNLAVGGGRRCLRLTPLRGSNANSAQRNDRVTKVW